MSWIKCDSKVKAKCSFKNKCCGDQEGIYLEGSECDKFAQKVLSEPPTNADRIRAMSDEELARWLSDVWDCDYCSEHERLGHHPLLRDEPCDQKCEEHCLDWLQQPAEEVEHE